MKIRSLVGLAIAAAAVLPVVQAADTRTWMSRKGGLIEAELGGVDGVEVTLITPDAKELKVKTEDLSLADRQHLVEYGGAEESILTGGDPGTPEKDLRIDSAGIKRLDDKLAFDGASEAVFELLESPHFLIATAGGVRPQGIAETAERLWHGMAFQHMNFRKDWGDKRMLIILAEDRAAYKALGDWYKNFLGAMNEQDAALSVGVTWDKLGSTNLSLSDEMTSRFNLLDSALVFNVTDDSKFRRPMAPFPIHSISKALLAKQMGGVSSYGSEGYFAITTGHAYFKEITLGGKSETQLLDVSGTGKDEISSKSGFEDGSSWARTLKPMVRRGQVKTQLEPMFGWKATDLTPERLVLIYSFANYMQNDAKRLASFAKMIRRIESSNQIPAAIEVARIFGFEDVESLEEDWKKFIIEGNFK